MPAPKAEWRLGLASVRLWSGDPWLGVKSTRRAVYDATRAALPEGLDEVLFLNERGEVCEGTITTVFFDRGQGMRTPPLSCGLLPGVLRAELACPEEVLMAEDLPRVRLWWAMPCAGWCRRSGVADRRGFHTPGPPWDIWRQKMPAEAGPFSV